MENYFTSRFAKEDASCSISIITEKSSSIYFFISRPLTLKKEGEKIDNIYHINYLPG